MKIKEVVKIIKDFEEKYDSIVKQYSEELQLYDDWNIKQTHKIDIYPFYETKFNDGEYQLVVLERGCCGDPDGYFNYTIPQEFLDNPEQWVEDKIKERDILVGETIRLIEQKRLEQEKKYKEIQEKEELATFLRLKEKYKGL